MSKTCVTWLCGNICEESIKRYNYIKRDCEKIGFDLVWIKDNDMPSEFKKENFPDIKFYFFNHDTLAEKYRQLIYMNNCFNTILALLEFHKDYAEYDYIWMIEEDVVMGNNNWYKLFEWSKDNTMDCLCTNLEMHYLTDSIYEKDYCYNKLHELSKNGDEPFHPIFSDMKYIWHGFFCIYRLSAKAIDILTDYYQQYNGFFEYVIPSILRYNRLHVEDIGQEFYNKFGHDINVGSITWKTHGISNWYQRESKYDCYDGLIFHPYKLDEKIIE